MRVSWCSSPLSLKRPEYTSRSSMFEAFSMSSKRSIRARKIALRDENLVLLMRQGAAS